MDPNEQILIGAIIEKSPADLDGRLRPGDELLFVDGIPVVGKAHRYVIDLMHAAGRNGQVNLVIRRRTQAGGKEPDGFATSSLPLPAISQTFSVQRSLTDSEIRILSFEIEIKQVLYHKCCVH